MGLCWDVIYINNNKKNQSQVNMQLKSEKESTSSISGFSTLSAQRIICSLSEYQCTVPLPPRDSDSVQVRPGHQYFLTFCRSFHYTVRIKNHWFAFKYITTHRILGLIQCYPGCTSLIWKFQNFLKTDMMPQVENSTPDLKWWDYGQNTGAQNSFFSILKGKRPSESLLL